MTIIKKMDRYTEKGITTLFLITMSIFVFMQVVSRYVFGNSYTWTEELSRYLFIWLIFLTIGINFKERSHISIDFALDLLHPTIRKVIKQFNYLVLLIISILFVWEGYVMSMQIQMLGQTSSNLQLPMWWVYISLPIGFLLTIFRLIQSSVLLWTQSDQKDEVDS